MKTKWKKLAGGLLVIAAVSIPSANLLAADATEKSVETNTSEAAGETAPLEREILPAKFGIPKTFPTKGQHPQVMFSEKDLPAIRENMRNQQGAKATRDFYKLLEIDTDGVLPDELVGNKSNIDYKIFAVIESYAFDYAINGNVENGKRRLLQQEIFLIR